MSYRCATAYDQCGGDNWDGRHCCPGTVCQVQSEYYSQCHPSSSPAHASFGVGAHSSARGSNLFAANHFYVNEAYQQRVKSSMQARWAEGETLSQMTHMLSVPSAFWVDRVAKIEGGVDEHEDAGATTLDSILADAATKSSPPPLVVAILCAPTERISKTRLRPHSVPLAVPLTML